ncbi:hypothetical protein GCM10007359_06430 [Rothia aerolata]|uniref:Uncharacterized protein n=2 Tax=Micrococcaceae TaxID=1268 RepID=A0A917MRB4_9MICC|nr:hypothetical protein [Rothia aerolata]GGH59338.1 hypothetical protein GCM10007359_06430 [Rothia aerolata]
MSRIETCLSSEADEDSSSSMKMLRRTVDNFSKEALMSKRGRKRKDRRKGSANHGKRPNA